MPSRTSLRNRMQAGAAAWLAALGIAAAPMPAAAQFITTPGVESYTGQFESYAGLGVGYTHFESNGESTNPGVVVARLGLFLYDFLAVETRFGRSLAGDGGYDLAEAIGVEDENGYADSDVQVERLMGLYLTPYLFNYQDDLSGYLIFGFTDLSFAVEPDGPDADRAYMARGADFTAGGGLHFYFGGPSPQGGGGSVNVEVISYAREGDSDDFDESDFLVGMIGFNYHF